jgi:hypothetical protein
MKTTAARAYQSAAFCGTSLATTAVATDGAIRPPGRSPLLDRGKLNKADRSLVKRINPFGAIDPNSFTVSPLTADAAGNIYYNVLKLQNNISFYDADAVLQRPGALPRGPDGN